MSFFSIHIAYLVSFLAFMYICFRYAKKQLGQFLDKKIIAVEEQITKAKEEQEKNLKNLENEKELTHTAENYCASLLEKAEKRASDLTIKMEEELSRHKDQLTKETKEQIHRLEKQFEQDMVNYITSSVEELALQHVNKSKHKESDIQKSLINDFEIFANKSSG
ncbi:MAG: F0F1 ATP synthase subunit B family protein [Alphaproteobacteria bacterium]